MHLIPQRSFPRPESYRVETRELFRQAEREGDEPYSRSPSDMVNLMGTLVGHPQAFAGPKRTHFEHCLRERGAGDAPTTGQVVESLRSEQFQKLGAGLAFGAISAATLYGAFTLFEMAASLGVGALGLAATAALGAKRGFEEAGKTYDLIVQTESLARRASERLDPDGLP